MPSGGLAVWCRTCPDLLINLPLDWEAVDPSTSWLYSLILSQDANFHLKSCLRSSDDKDPALRPGYAYFVDPEQYAQHLCNYIDEEEVRTTPLSCEPV